MKDESLNACAIDMAELVSRFHFPDRVWGYCVPCPNHGKKWSCPPFGFDVPELLGRYKYAYLFGVKMIYDDETRALAGTKEKALDTAVGLMRKVNTDLQELLRGIEADYPGSLAASGGTCRICDTCARPEDKPCRFPDKMRPSVESLGFDVTMITEELLGIKLVWFDEGLPEYQTLVNALFTSERRDEILDRKMDISV
jgi:predicted metal-binding protein